MPRIRIAFQNPGQTARPRSVDAVARAAKAATERLGRGEYNVSEDGRVWVVHSVGRFDGRVAIVVTDWSTTQDLRYVGRALEPRAEWIAKAISCRPNRWITVPRDDEL